MMHFNREGVDNWFRTHFGKEVFLIKSCTAAFEIIADYLEFGPGDEVIAPAFCFPSVVHPFLRRGGSLQWVDSERDRPHIDVGQLEGLINERTRVILVIHYGGIPCEIEGLDRLRLKYRIPIIEDAAHAFGVWHRAKYLGTHFDFGAFSFHRTKNITCYEGGALTLGEVVKGAVIGEVCQFGTNRAEVLNGKADHYEWQRLGGAHNLALPLISMLEGQMDAIAEINENRRQIAIEYDRLFVDQLPNSWILPFYGEHTNGHIYPICCPKGVRTEYVSYMRSKGINCAMHYQALSASPAAKRLSMVGYCPNADRFARDLVRLPLYYGMQDIDVSTVVKETLAFIKAGG